LAMTLAVVLTLYSAIIYLRQYGKVLGTTAA
jgi:hypothetical protein